MKRLADQLEQLDGSERQLAELFAKAEPTRIDPFRKRRILVNLSKRAGARPLGGRVAVAASLLLGATIAAATVGRSPIKAAWSNLRGGHTVALDSSRQRASQDLTGSPANRVEETTNAQVLPGSSSSQLTAVPENPTGSVSAQPRSNAEPSRAANNQDPSQVALAIRALRNDHDPVRARKLLSRYLQTQPQGALAEDALALSIEAAAATNDSKTADIARVYLAKYPNGRYQAMAVKALGRR